MRDDFVVEHDHRGAELLGEIEGADGLRIDFLHRSRGHDDDRVIAVGSPSRLHEVALRGPRRHAGRRAAAHHVDDDARRLGHRGVAEILLHQRKAGSAGGGHRLDAAERSADDGGERSDLVLHLDEDAVDARQLARQLFGDFRGRRDRIAGEKAASGGEGAERAGAIALQRMKRRRHSGDHRFAQRRADGNGEVRAQPFADMAARAGFGVFQDRDLFGVELQAALRAHFHADVAALAPGGVDFERDGDLGLRRRGGVAREAAIEPQRGSARAASAQARPASNALRLIARLLLGVRDSRVESQSSTG